MTGILCYSVIYENVDGIGSKIIGIPSISCIPK